MKLTSYLESQGQGAQSRLAAAICAHQPDISFWAKGKRPVPVERCVAIEIATNGEVTRRDLRPNDWGDIWPELIDGDHPWPKAEVSA